MTEPARYVCLECDTEYMGHAEYCNVCGAERFERRGGVESPKPSLRGDGTILVVQATLWLVALLYLLGERAARHPVDVLWAWAFASTASLVLGLVSKHLRAALVFIGLGATFAAVAVWIRA